MNMTVLAFFVGLFLGAFAAIAVMALMMVAKQSDKQMPSPPRVELDPEDSLLTPDKHIDKRV